MIKPDTASLRQELGDTPKAQLLQDACNLAIDALHSARNELASGWDAFIALDGTLGKPRKKRGKNGACESRAPAKALNVQENAITSKLESPIRRHLSSKPLNHAARVIHLSCHIEANVPSETKAGDSLNRADIRFEMVGMENSDLDIVFEAKVLKRVSEIKTAYIGDDGLGRFCRENEPFTEGPIGGLIAYVNDSGAAEFQTKLNEAVQLHKTTECTKTISLGEGSLHQQYCSKHTRDGHNAIPIWMIHMLMGFPYLSVSTNSQVQNGG